jgi:hypothetical protein
VLDTKLAGRWSVSTPNASLVGAVLGPDGASEGEAEGSPDDDSEDPGEGSIDEELVAVGELDGSRPAGASLALPMRKPPRTTTTPILMAPPTSATRRRSKR